MIEKPSEHQGNDKFITLQTFCVFRDIGWNMCAGESCIPDRNNRARPDPSDERINMKNDFCRKTHTAPVLKYVVR